MHIRSVSGLQVLVEAVSLGNELLLPLAESLLFDLDLLGETLPQSLLLFLELRVVQLSRSGLAELSCFHLLCAVGFVVLLLGGVDEIKHVSAYQDRAQLLEVTVVLVLDFSNTPGILATLYYPVVVGLHIFLGSNYSEGHSSHQTASVRGSVLVVLFDRRSVDLDALSFDNSFDLKQIGRVSIYQWGRPFIRKSHSLLETGKISRAKSVGLGNNGNEVDSRAQPLHDLNIKRLQSVARGSDEVQAGVNTHIDLVCAAGLLLLKHVRFVLVIKELDNWLPGVTVVDIVAEAGGINDGQADCTWPN